MVRTRGGSRYRPRVRFNTPEMEVVTLLSLAFLCSETYLYFGWEEKLELGVSSIMFCTVLALSTAYSFCIGFMY